MRDAFNRVDRTDYRDFASQPSSPRAEEFGIKKPLKEIVKYLVRDQKYKMGELKLGSESVREFYEKLERLRSFPDGILEKNYFAEFHLQIKKSIMGGESSFG
uniref:Uncharacterized protein n=1 Tax=Rhizophagus irregularis (strain DAOM 181602 / DAOM 197198 / MUCL 43194) TaxID=747089 RepID=U9TIL8_RHIID